MTPAEADETAPGERPPGVAPWLPDGWFDLPLLRRRQIVFGVVVTIVALPLVLLTTAGDDDDGADPPTQTGPTEAETYVAGMDPDRVHTFDSLAQCESEGDWAADTGNGFFGGLQFTQQSWQEVGGTGNPAAASREEQIMRGDMLQQLQGWGAWPRCSVQLGLG